MVRVSKIMFDLVLTMSVGVFLKEGFFVGFFTKDFAIFYLFLFCVLVCLSHFVHSV